MHYIKKEDRLEIRHVVNLLSQTIATKGDLNYAICELVGRLILKTEISYTVMSEWIDGVHDAEDELRERLLRPYERQMKEENGDVEAFDLIMMRMFPGDYR